MSTACSSVCQKLAEAMPGKEEGWNEWLNMQALAATGLLSHQTCQELVTSLGLVSWTCDSIRVTCPLAMLAVQGHAVWHPGAFKYSCSTSCKSETLIMA